MSRKDRRGINNLVGEGDKVLKLIWNSRIALTVAELKLQKVKIADHAEMFSVLLGVKFARRCKVA